MSKKNDLVLFNSNFEGMNVEIITDENGDLLFELYSTGMALGYTKESKGKKYAQKDRIEKVITNAGISTVVHSVQQYLNEEMLYDFMLEARTDKCKAFRKWVTSEVLPSIRQNGAYVSKNITPEQEERLDKFSTTRKIKNTFKNCNLESIEQEFKECMIYHKNKKGKEKNTIQSIIINALNDRKQLLIDSGKGAFALAVAEVTNLITKKQKETNNKSRGQIISYKEKVISKLEDEIENLNPPLSKYMVLTTHGISENYLYETVIDNNTGKNITVKTNTYKKWINNFPSEQLKKKEDLGVDWNKPIIVFLKFDCMPRFDKQNLLKGAIDQIITREYQENDNIIDKIIVEKNMDVDSYKDGRIYCYIKNAD